jgi:hypothetical protein
VSRDPVARVCDKPLDQLLVQLETDIRVLQEPVDVVVRSYESFGISVGRKLELRLQRCLVIEEEAARRGVARPDEE